MKMLLVALLLAAGLATAQPLPAVGPSDYPGTLQVRVDATDVERRILRVQQTLPVRPGPLVLYYPSWVPGWHSPTGRITQFAGLTLRAGPRLLEWRRNSVEMNAFHLEVPPGVSSIEAEFQYLASVDGGSGRVDVTREMLCLAWDTVLLYPAGHDATRIVVQAELRLPAGWQHASALELEAQDGARRVFRPVNLDTLVDSPVLAGRFVRQVDLDPGAKEAGRAPVRLTIAAEQPGQLAATPEQVAIHAALVTQADRLFGARPFRHYDFLLAVGDSLGENGLEHWQSSENVVPANYFTEWAKSAPGRDLLAHEYAHVWNGKWRRPAELLTPHFNTPVRNGLLWVYEGQTEFWGHVLAARSGLLSPAEARDNLALTAAWLQARAGRRWRNLQDTTHEPVIAGGRWQRDWRSWQRAGDYYDEARLIWIEADALIRERSAGQRSMDDFARNFFAVPAGRAAPELRPQAYGFDDVVRALNGVLAHDWAAFLRERLDGHDGATLAAGLRRAGWQLAWSEQPSEYLKAAEARDKRNDFSHSIGLSVGEDGKIAGVIWDGPAFQAGLAAGATLLAVNGRAYKPELLKEAITEARSGGQPIELLLRSQDLFRSVRIDYRGGLRYPKLERVEGSTDHLGALLAPR